MLQISFLDLWNSEYFHCFNDQVQIKDDFYEIINAF